MKKTTMPVSVRFTDEQRNQIKKRGNELGLDDANLIRLAVSLFLANNFTNAKNQTTKDKGE